AKQAGVVLRSSASVPVLTRCKIASLAMSCKVLSTTVREPLDADQRDFPFADHDIGGLDEATLPLAGHALRIGGAAPTGPHRTRPSRSVAPFPPAMLPASLHRRLRPGQSVQTVAQDVDDDLDHLQAGDRGGGVGRIDPGLRTIEHAVRV